MEVEAVSWRVFLIEWSLMQQHFFSGMSFYKIKWVCSMFFLFLCVEFFGWF